jgi:hypothetical protein
MRSFLSALILLAVLTAAPLLAQSSHGYVFAAPGAISAGGFSSATLHAGGGFEAIVWRRWIGVGGEGGYLTPTNNWDGGLGVVSPNAYVHFGGDRFRGIDPFATVGYSLLFRSSTANAINYGGGLNWWIGEGAGLKFEVRDHAHDGAHYWGIRFGVTFR